MVVTRGNEAPSFNAAVPSRTRINSYVNACANYRVESYPRRCGARDNAPNTVTS